MDWRRANPGKTLSSIVNEPIQRLPDGEVGYLMSGGYYVSWTEWKSYNLPLSQLYTATVCSQAVDVTAFWYNDCAALPILGSIAAAFFDASPRNEYFISRTSGHDQGGISLDPFNATFNQAVAQGTPASVPATVNNSDGSLLGATTVDYVPGAEIYINKITTTGHPHTLMNAGDFCSVTNTPVSGKTTVDTGVLTVTTRGTPKMRCVL